MSGTPLKALVGLLLLAAPATIAFGNATEQAPSTTSPAAFAASAEGEVVETYEADLDPVPSTGELDLRIDHGAVRVIGWDKPSYQIQVIRAASTASVPDDPEIQRDFQDDSTDDHLDLNLTVDQEGVFEVEAGPNQAHIGTGGENVAIVAKVPRSIAYTSIYACQGQWRESPDVVQPPRTAQADEDGPCLEPEEPTSSPGTAVVRVGSDPGLNVTTGAESLDGTELAVETTNDDIAAASIDFDTLTLSTNNGDIDAENLTAGELVLHSNNGDVLAQAIDADASKIASNNGDLDLEGAFGELQAESNNGDVSVDGEATGGSLVSNNGRVDAKLVPTAVGEMEVSSNNGEVTLEVPTGQRYGYDATAQTNNGEAEVDLSGAQDQGAEDASDHDRQGSDQARTQGFEGREIRWTITASSNNGDVLVHDGSTDGDDGGDDGSQPDAVSGLVQG